VGGGRGAYRVYVGKPEGNGPLGRYIRRWDNIKRIVKTLYGRAWTGLIQLRAETSSRLLLAV